MRKHMGLFRGKRTCNSEWIEGYFIPALEKDSCSIYDIEHPELGYYVDPDTVGECTGLTDKNGKLIFEGDIIQANNGSKTTVVFHLGGFHSCFDSGFGKYYGGIIPEFKTVVGNIHDNPELLKDGEADE